MSEETQMTRREFFQASSGAAVATLGILAATTGQAASAATTEPQREAKRNMATAANDKVVIGVIGVAGRGYGAHMKAFGGFPDVEIGAVCDVYQTHLDRAVAATEGKAKAYHDYRQLLENKDIDAVTIATPPHWHAIIAAEALQAGKDVYCEKPMCRFPAEGRVMAEFAKRYKRITQVGTQIHATPNYHKCVDVVRSGALGKITSVTNFCTMNDNSEGLGNPPDSEPLPGLDWDMWLGPAPKVPFNIGRFRDGMHRYFKDYVDSWLHELGPHIVDLPFWALELGHPTGIAASGGRYATTSIADVPDTLQVLWEFPDMTMTWNLMQHNAFHFGVGAPGPGRHNGIVFHGKEGTLAIVNYGTPQVTDKDGKEVEGVNYPKSVPDSPGHEREFIDGVKSRQECSCSFANHLPLHTAMNLAHLSLHVGRKLHWDAEKWEVVGDREANHLITPEYRAPWKLPKL
ncbi:MAG TPA: Gfo/Idh/MocA family oxidoreductase [Chthonomonadaceae bacterium]|nr:Gfo/Idh/MocA family oxidoreductase [Chthonomonadaceae bacterium]